MIEQDVKSLEDASAKVAEQKLASKKYWFS